jgi:hypothetical protein
MFAHRHPGELTARRRSRPSGRLLRVRAPISALAPAFITASTLLGVLQLGFGHQRVELDLTAALH